MDWELKTNDILEIIDVPVNVMIEMFVYVGLYVHADSGLKVWFFQTRNGAAGGLCWFSGFSYVLVLWCMVSFLGLVVHREFCWFCGVW